MTLKELQLALIEAQRNGVPSDQEIVLIDNVDDSLCYGIIDVWENSDEHNRREFGITIAQLLEE